MKRKAVRGTKEPKSTTRRQTSSQQSPVKSSPSKSEAIQVNPSFKPLLDALFELSDHEQRKLVIRLASDIYGGASEASDSIVNFIDMGELRSAIHHLQVYDEPRPSDPTYEISKHFFDSSSLSENLRNVAKQAVKFLRILETIKEPALQVLTQLHSQLEAAYELRVRTEHHENAAPDEWQIEDGGQGQLVPGGTEPSGKPRRVDQRKGDRHKTPRNRNRNRNQELKAQGLKLIPVYIKEELINRVKKVAQERGASFRDVVSESFERTVAEHEKSRNSEPNRPVNTERAATSPSGATAKSRPS
jgi:hypothetical protein